MFSSNQIAARHLKTCGTAKTVIEKGVKETLCHLCEKEFALNKHNLIHEKKFRCDICEKIFSRKDNLQTHIQTHFLSKNTVDLSSNMVVEYICSFCNKAYRSKEDLVKHFETDLSCNRNCQEQLYQEVTDYHDEGDHISKNQCQITLTQVVGADRAPSEVFAEIVDNNSEIILVDNDANQEVLIIEEPVVYI